MATMERLIAQLPAGVGYEWTGQSYEEKKSGSQTGPLYAISLIAILLCLAALYESWPIPISVMRGGAARGHRCDHRHVGARSQ